ncbi:MAG: hypothetical protein R8P61_04970 [Bacteroidia bacterium]|nr:hypothetical protein [Bacteroidia bacterium]
MNTNFRNGDRLMSIAAIIVSVGTLVVFSYQTNLIRKQQFMSVYPHLDIGHYGSNGLNYKYLLKNEGIGPAMIKSVKITDKAGKSYDKLLEYLEDHIYMEDSIFYYHSDIFEGRFIPAGEEIPLIGLLDNESLKVYGDIRNTLEGSMKLKNALSGDSLDFEIVYESIYEESWTINNEAYMPEKN